MLKTLFYPVILFDLQRFADGGGTGDGAGVAAADAGQQAGDDLSVMQYGKQAGPADAEPVQPQEQAPPPKDLAAEFDKMVKGEYKEQFNRRVQDILQKRFRAQEKDLNAYKALAPTLEILSKKYGVDASNVVALNKAIEDDDAYYEAEAFEKGVPVSELKAAKKMERENAQLKAELEAVHQQQEVDNIMLDLRKQADALKAIYPQFDLQKEMENEAFRSLVGNKYVTMQAAYEVVHKDEIIPAAMQIAATKAAEKVANSVRSGVNRPQESATQPTAPSLVKSDVSQLTNADIDEINRRVARGERITF